MAGLDIWTPPADWTVGTGLTETKLNQQVRDDLTVVRKVLEGDVSSQWVHSHKGGTYADLPAAGNAGRFYLANDMGVVFIDDGTYWQPAYAIHGLCQHLFDEFWNEPGAEDGAGTTDGARWSISRVGTGAVILQGTTGSNARSSLHIKLPALNDEGNMASLEEIWRLASVRTPMWFETLLIIDVTQIDFLVGFADSLPGGGTRPSNGIWFELDTAVHGDSNWRSVTGKAGAYEVKDTGVAASSLPHQRLVIVADSETSVSFFIDDLNTPKTVHTTAANLPAAGTSMHLSFQARALTTNRDMLADHVEMFCPKSLS